MDVIEIKVTDIPSIVSEHTLESICETYII